jgi:hypothetical protein
MAKDDSVRLRHMVDSAIDNYSRTPMGGKIKYANKQTLKESLSHRGET